MSNTYSRYVADTTGNIDILFSKWQILVNDNDITSDFDSSITFVPIIEENPHIANNTIGPSSKGYFDIAIDPTNVNVSFKYNITLDVANENIPDLMITKYSIILASYDGEDPLDIYNLEGNTISDVLIYDKTVENFNFEPFTIRIYFEWYEGENELMDDEADTIIGHLAASEGVPFEMSANITFEQVLN
jgi:hypothetical protein